MRNMKEEEMKGDNEQVPKGSLKSKGEGEIGEIIDFG